MEPVLSKRLIISNALLSQLPELVKNELLESTISKQELFVKLYQKKSHSLLLTYLFLLPVILSFHYGVLDNWTKQIIFWFTGGGLLIWWFIDLLRLPAIVKETNHSIAYQIWDEVSSIGEGPAEGLF
ncbi:MAG TPA: hypothetical protein VK921_08175 [Anditalea sp.]|nr:hypothetical protein [Anditalea sp.]